MSEPNPAAEITERPCPFVTFYSFKGGVGRSMAVINVAGIMASRGFRVLVIDMDLEAPGLSFLANPAPAEEQARSLQPGFVDLLLDAVERGPDADLFRLPPADAIRGYSAPYELPEGFRRSPDGSLHIMPAGRIDGDYTRRLTSLGLPSLYQEGVGLALIKAFKHIVQSSKLFDYVLVDSRTGFSDESGICTRDLADCLMVVSGLNKQNVEGTTQFLSALRRATNERKPLEVILSPIPNGEDALVDEREKRAQAAFTKGWGAPVRTELHIPYHPQLALTEEPHIFRRRKGYLFDAYNKIERSTLSLLGDTWRDVLELATAALKAKRYAIAEAHLRRVDKLAYTREWAGVGLLRPKADWVADPAAESVFHFIIEKATTENRVDLGWWIGREAVRRIDTSANTAIALFERALEAVPNDADNLGNYAIFLGNGRKDLDAAEAMYKRSVAADPTHAHNLGAYALFLENERKDLDAAEAMYKQAVNADPTHADNLGAYALFLGNERKDLDAAEAMYKRAVDAAPTHADNLGAYALFLENERKDLDAAEAMYKRAVDADPTHAHNLVSYALFLENERKDFDAAKAMYKRAVDADPTHADNLGVYALLLENERKDLDAAEAMYKQAVDADPTHADNLGNYALFLQNERKDLESAEAMYKRAVDADPKHANNLGNYALFLQNERKDFDAAETMYKRAVDADPTHADNLSNYANFFGNERKDLDAAKAMYKRAVDADPTHADNLGVYALLLENERKDLDAAEAMYKQAVDADPTHADNLGNYANFLGNERKDLDAAEAMYRRAIDADPKDANNLGNYARIRLSIDRVGEGMELVDKALTIRASLGSPYELDAELWMYAFCCGSPDRHRDALQQLRALVLTHSINTGDWDFSGIIQQACAMAHPEAAWLPLLADVLGGRREPATLDDWPAWRTAARPHDPEGQHDRRADKAR